MSRCYYLAELITAVGGVVATLNAPDLATLRKMVAVEFVPYLEDGDLVKITENYED